MRGLQVRVGLVERVLQPPPVQITGRLPKHLRDRSLAEPSVGRDPALVDVVAEVENQVQVLLSHPGQRGVVAVRPGLAGGEREIESAAVASDRWCRSSAADDRDVTAVAEPVEQLSVTRQTGDVDVDRMGQLRKSPYRSATHNAPKPGIVGDLPRYRQASIRHSAVSGRDIGVQPGPQHHRVLGGVPAGHAECERVSAASRPRTCLGWTHRILRHCRQPGHARHPAEKPTSRKIEPTHL